MMLNRIEIRDFSLLRDTSVEFTPGLTVLTGESGSGKTLLFDAVSFALGGRSQRSLLARGATSCEVGLELEIDKKTAKHFGPPWKPGVNVIQRRLSQSGRNRITINGESANVADVQALGEALFEIAGQFESRILFNPAAHLGLIDAFGDSKLFEMLEEYQAGYTRWSALRTRLNALRASAASREQEIDFLTFQVDELDKAAVREGERSEVESRSQLLENATAIVNAATGAARLLAGDDDVEGAYDLAAKAQSQFDNLVRLLEGVDGLPADPEDLAGRMTIILEELQELASECRQLAEGVSDDPAELESVRERLDELNRLERKFTCTADELPRLLSEKQERLDLLSDTSQDPQAIEKELDNAEKGLKELGNKITKARSAAVKQLVKLSLAFFNRLDFPHVALEVEMEQSGSPGPDGFDSAEILISLNPGEPAKPLAQVASGGEASRLMLGLKAALAGRTGSQVLMFDEIEAGLGGKAAQHVADVLCELSDSRQVVAISHLPVVAVRARTHLLAMKTVENNTTSVSVNRLDDARRREELARMVGGTGTLEEAALVDSMLKTAGQK